MASLINNLVDMTELENIILELVFSKNTIKNGIKNFQFVSDSPQLHIDGELSPQNIFNHAPEQSIISIDTPAISYYPNSEAGHLFAITGNMPTKQERRAIPIICFWTPTAYSSDLYVATYTGNGTYFKWRKISAERFGNVETLQNQNEDVTMTYRVVSDIFLEFSLDTTNVAYPTQTNVFTLPYRPAENRNLFFPMVQWSNDGAPSGMNGMRLRSDGKVDVICVDKYCHTHGFFTIA